MSSHYMDFSISIMGNSNDMKRLSEKLNYVIDNESIGAKELKFYLEEYRNENEELNLEYGYENINLEISVSKIEKQGFDIDVPFKSFMYKVVEQLVALEPNLRIVGGCSEIITSIDDDIQGFDFKSIAGDDRAKFRILIPYEDSHNYDDEYDEESEIEDTYQEDYFYSDEYGKDLS